MSKYMKTYDKYIITCPSCGNSSFSMVEFSYKTPFFGEILILSGKCSKCGYRYFDSFNLEEHKAVRFVLKITNAEELNSMVIKSSTAKVEIPELGITIEPGPSAQAYISTVEGILYRVLEVLEVYAQENREKYEAKKKEISEAIDGKIKFTFILEDQYGNSLVIPKNNRNMEVKYLNGTSESYENT